MSSSRFSLQIRAAFLISLRPLKGEVFALFPTKVSSFRDGEIGAKTKFWPSRRKLLDKFLDVSRCAGVKTEAKAVEILEIDCFSIRGNLSAGTEVATCFDTLTNFARDPPYCYLFCEF